MATNNSTTQRTPIEPIEQTDSKKKPTSTKPKTPAEKTTITEPPKSANKPIQKSVRKMSFEEFATYQGFSRIFTAGFKMYMNGVAFLSEEDWHKKLQEYKNRTV